MPASPSVRQSDDSADLESQSDDDDSACDCYCCKESCWAFAVGQALIPVVIVVGLIGIAM